jgi:GT2 family glycosyltransferase
VLPYAPYGGLLLSRLLLERIGLPNSLFVVYSDDSEFTSRIPAAGGRILLVGDSVVDDIAPSGLGAERDTSMIPKWSWYAIESEQRAYYAARNQIAFEASRANSRALFLLNGAIVTAWMILLGVASRRTSRMRVIVRALADGVRGRLGPRRPLPSR